MSQTPADEPITTVEQLYERFLLPFQDFQKKLDNQPQNVTDNEIKYFILGYENISKNFPENIVNYSAYWISTAENIKYSISLIVNIVVQNNLKRIFDDTEFRIANYCITQMLTKSGITPNKNNT